MVFTGSIVKTIEEIQETGEFSWDGSFDEKFISGINVFIGANATGKTTILKCLYAVSEFCNPKNTFAKTGEVHNIEDKSNYVRKFQDYFSSSKRTVKELNYKTDDCFELINVFAGDKKFHYDGIEGGTFLNLDEWSKAGIKSVLIPTAEMLSHSKGLVAMSLKWDIPFDATQTDILVNAQLPETKEISDRNKKLLKMINNIIGGDVTYENDTFYVVKSDGLKVEFSLEAEGFKKLGLLWKLIRNGLLESGTILLWDEPEASINPEVMPLLVEILYILKNDGVQIFLATHNYMLAKYIELKKQSDDDVLFISLHKNEKGEIKTARASRYSELIVNPIETAEENLFNAVVEKSMEG
jgi:AAA15 family ATPase/GTPase